MRFDTLQQWLDWQETLHPQAIDLGLERVAAVADALQLRTEAPTTVTIAGTNGKGTVATVVAALLRAMGFRVGLYTSPHLLRYNERVSVNGEPASDDALCRAFAAADAARGPRTLTYFEFGTLAAAWLFREARVDFQVLEVGLGGRLDAVNVWDPDVAAITSVDLDHQAWLGNDRERIGWEKAGILRPGRPAVLGEASPPASVLGEALRLDVPLSRFGHDFMLDVSVPGGRWAWAGGCADLGLDATLTAALTGARGQNAATALAVVHLLQLQDRLGREVLQSGLGAAPPGRLQRVAGTPEWLLDVAHNPQSARELAAWLERHPVPGPVVAIVAVMADKDRGPMFATLDPEIDVWVPVSIPSRRALPANELARELEILPGRRVVRAEEPGAAMAVAAEQAGPGGRVVVLGSFMTVQAVLERLPPAGGDRVRA
ncbi:bifunctional tetrahydrofolate synthase/dihydrofolate synthase [Thioalkalivibrio sp.]|uniref:bifunctional tetrahydrofolate synthase/dihydrofolate synthase n=1 Tax=Thioalkalivibrio sp. TaxID=2093813 RepID=UPI003975762B